MDRNQSFYEILTPAASFPVTLAEAKTYLRITHDAEDDLINALIEAATNVLEKYTNRTFVTTTFRGLYSNLLYTKTERWPVLDLERSPLQSVSAVEELVSGSWTAVGATYWELRELSGNSRILFDTIGLSSLTPTEPQPYSFRIDFVAGYDPVPETIKMGIKTFINYIYTNRGDCAMVTEETIPSITKSLINKYKVKRVY